MATSIQSTVPGWRWKTRRGDLALADCQPIDLGDEALVKRLPARAPVAGDTLSVPQAPRRPPPDALVEITTHRSGRKAVRMGVYATGADTGRPIAEYFGVHLATVGHIVGEARRQCEN